MECRCGATSAPGWILCRCCCCSLFSSRLTLGECGVSTDGAGRSVAGSRCQSHNFGKGKVMRKICTAVFAASLFFPGVQGIAQTPRHIAVHAGHVLDVKTGKL